MRVVGVPSALDCPDCSLEQLKSLFDTWKLYDDADTFRSLDYVFYLGSYMHYEYYVVTVPIGCPSHPELRIILRVVDNEQISIESVDCIP